MYSCSNILFFFLVGELDADESRATSVRKETFPLAASALRKALIRAISNEVADSSMEIRESWVFGLRKRPNEIFFLEV